MYWSLQSFLVAIYDQFDVRGTTSLETKWLWNYNMTSDVPPLTETVNRRMSSCIKLVTNREPGWYLLPFGGTHEALTTSPSSKYQTLEYFLQTEWSTLDTNVVSQGQYKICVGSLWIFLHFLANPWNTDTWPQIVFFPIPYRGSE